MTNDFPPEGRLIHVANEAQWNALATFLDQAGVKLFEIPPGPSVPDSSETPTYGLMFKKTDGDD